MLMSPQQWDEDGALPPHHDGRKTSLHKGSQHVRRQQKWYYQQQPTEASSCHDGHVVHQQLLSNAERSTQFVLSFAFTEQCQQARSQNKEREPLRCPRSREHEKDQTCLQSWILRIRSKPGEEKRLQYDSGF